MPRQKIFRAFRNVGNHLKQHDGFVEMIQIVRGKPGARIDIGGAQLGRPRLPVRVGLGLHLPIGLRWHGRR